MSTTNRKSWAVVEFETTSQNEELAGWVMINIAGAIGCEVRSADSGRVCIHATFDKESLAQDDVSRIGSVLEEYGLGESLATLRTQALHEEDWLAKWKQGFKQFSIGERLLVCPPWDVPDKTERTLIVIEPAMAFGTGLHATTRFCLRMIETLDLGASILDVGTGSGILAIAAVLLNPGAAVTAIDTDPVAIDAARKNCELNGIPDRIKLIVGSTETVATERFDDILSNLTCEDIVALLPDYSTLLKPGGRIVCAGVLIDKLPILANAAPTYGFSLEKTEESAPWCGILLRKGI